MKLLSYIGKYVHVTLTLNGFYYKGLVLSADEDSLTLKDKVGKVVTLRVNSIETIREVL